MIVMTRGAISLFVEAFPDEMCIVSTRFLQLALLVQILSMKWPFIFPLFFGGVCMGIVSLVTETLHLIIAV